MLSRTHHTLPSPLPRRSSTQFSSRTRSDAGLPVELDRAQLQELHSQFSRYCVPDDLLGATSTLSEDHISPSSSTSILHQAIRDLRNLAHRLQLLLDTDDRNNSNNADQLRLSPTSQELRSAGLRLMDDIDREIALYTEFINPGEDLSLSNILHGSATQSPDGPDPLTEPDYLDLDHLNSIDDGSVTSSSHHPQSHLNQFIPPTSPGEFMSPNTYSGLTSPTIQHTTSFNPIDANLFGAPSNGAMSPRPLLPPPANSSLLPNMNYGSMSTELSLLLSPSNLLSYVPLHPISQQIADPNFQENSGVPTTLAVGPVIVIGTSRGLLLVFDFHQKLKFVLGNTAISLEHGSISSISVSPDGSTVASGFSRGLILVWDVKQGNMMTMRLPQAQENPTGGAHHPKGHRIVQLKFCSNSSLVSCDSLGGVIHHIIYQPKVRILTGGLQWRSHHLTSSNSVAPILAVEPIIRTINNNNYMLLIGHDSLSLFNLPSNTKNLRQDISYSIATILRSHIQSGYKIKLMARDTAECDLFKFGVSGSGSWFVPLNMTNHSSPSNPLLAVGWGRYLGIYQLLPITADTTNKKERGGLVELKRVTDYLLDYSIVGVHWLNSRDIMLLDHREELHLLELNQNKANPLVEMGSLSQFNLITLPLTNFNSHQPSHLPKYDYSWACFRGKLYALSTQHQLQVIVPLTWASHVTQLIHQGHPIPAVHLATHYLKNGPQFYFSQLPSAYSDRRHAIGGELAKLVLASIQFMTKKWQEQLSVVRDEGLMALQDEALAVDLVEVSQLLNGCLAAALEIENYDLITGSIYENLLALNNLQSENEDNMVLNSYFNCLVHHLIHPTPRSIDLRSHIPPELTHHLLSALAHQHRYSELQQLLVQLPGNLLHLDHCIQLARSHRLGPALIHLWSVTLQDYLTPVIELVQLGGMDKLLMTYLQKLASNRTYPSNQRLPPPQQVRCRRQLIRLLTSTQLMSWPVADAGGKLFKLPAPYDNKELIYPYFHYLAYLDSFKLGELLVNLLSHSTDSEDQLSNQCLLDPCLHLLNTPQLSHNVKLPIRVFLANAAGSCKLVLPKSLTLDLLDQLIIVDSENSADDNGFREQGIQSLVDQVLSPPNISNDKLIDQTHNLLEKLESYQYFNVLRKVYLARNDLFNAVRVSLLDVQDVRHVFDILLGENSPDNYDLSQMKNLVQPMLIALIECDTKLSYQVVSRLWGQQFHDYIVDHILLKHPKLQLRYLDVYLYDNNDFKASLSSQKRWIELSAVDDVHLLLNKLQQLYLQGMEDRTWVYDLLNEKLDHPGIRDVLVRVLVGDGRNKMALEAAISGWDGPLDKLLGTLKSLTFDEPLSLDVHKVNKGLVRMGYWVTKSIQLCDESMQLQEEGEGYSLVLAKLVTTHSLLKSILRNLSNVEHQSTIQTLVEDTITDKLHDLFHSILHPTTVTSNISVSQLLINTINKTTANDPGGCNGGVSHLGEFRSMVDQVLRASQLAVQELAMVGKVTAGDQFRLVQQQVKQAMRGRRGFAPRCVQCRSRLTNQPSPNKAQGRQPTDNSIINEEDDNTKPQVIMFQCGHLAHKSCCNSSAASKATQAHRANLLRPQSSQPPQPINASAASNLPVGRIQCPKCQL